MKPLRSLNASLLVTMLVLAALTVSGNAAAGPGVKTPGAALEQKDLENKAVTDTGSSTDTAPKAADQKLHVTSDKMIALQDSSMVEFIGNVRATRGESIILADSIKIYFYSSDQKPKDASDQKKDGRQVNVEKIVSTGNVEYTEGERKAFADKMVYTTANEILVMTGNAPRLLTGKSWITGKKITLFKQNGRAMVESDGTNRVEAFFDPEDNPENKKK